MNSFSLKEQVNHAVGKLAAALQIDTLRTKKQPSAKKLKRTLGYCGLSQCLALGLVVAPVAAAEPGQVPESAAVERLLNMFSPEIQSTINACWESGKVNLAAGASQDGSVTCADGSRDSAVPFADYVDTVSDILTASSLVGFRTVIETNPRVSPEALVTFLSNPEGAEMLRDVIETAIAQSQLLPVDSSESATYLADEVISRMLPAVQSTGGLVDLLGTPDQYNQVVSRFCMSPGMSVDQAQESIPGLSSVQLYAICIQESGVTEEIQDGTGSSL